jgi:GntR family transcriptional regulator/MocR family aminotransferase
MRELYGNRLQALMDAGRRYLKGLLSISPVQAGLYTAAFLENGMSSRQAEAAAAAAGIQTAAIDRYTLERPDPNGLLLGFAAFDERLLRNASIQLAKALSRPNVR